MGSAGSHAARVDMPMGTATVRPTSSSERGRIERAGATSALEGWQGDPGRFSTGPPRRGELTRHEVRQRTRDGLGREVRRLSGRGDGGGGTRRGSHGRGVRPDRATGRDSRRARVAVSAPGLAGPGMVRPRPGDDPRRVPLRSGRSGRPSGDGMDRGHDRVGGRHAPRSSVRTWVAPARGLAERARRAGYGSPRAVHPLPPGGCPEGG